MLPRPGHDRTALSPMCRSGAPTSAPCLRSLSALGTGRRPVDEGHALGDFVELRDQRHVHREVGVGREHLPEQSDRRVLGDGDEADDVRRVDPSRGLVLDAGPRVEPTLGANCAPLELEALTVRADRARWPPHRAALGAEHEAQLARGGALPERRELGIRDLGERTAHAARSTASRMASAPSPRSPQPVTATCRTFSTWWSPASPRSWRTASTTWLRPDRWPSASSPPCVFNGRRPP